MSDEKKGRRQAVSKDAAKKDAPNKDAPNKDAQGHDVEGPEFHGYFSGIAEAHHVIRKVFRLVDEQAKKAGLEPLEHKLLIQVFGAPAAPLSVQAAATRLDVSSALASRLLKGLVDRGLVSRVPGQTDRRVTRVEITAAGRDLLAAVDRDVRHHVGLFQSGLTDAERDGALRIFSFYLGR